VTRRPVAPIRLRRRLERLVGLKRAADRWRGAEQVAPSALDPAHIDALIQRVTPAERRALRAIVDGADLIECDGQQFLLAPVSDAVLAALAEFESDEREDDADREDDELAEDDDGV